VAQVTPRQPSLIQLAPKSFRRLTYPISITSYRGFEPRPCDWPRPTRRRPHTVGWQLCGKVNWEAASRKDDGAMPTPDNAADPVATPIRINITRTPINEKTITAPASTGFYSHLRCLLTLARLWGAGARRGSLDRYRTQRRWKLTPAGFAALAHEQEPAPAVRERISELLPNIARKRCSGNCADEHSGPARQIV